MKRSLQNLSHEVKLTCNMGELIPVGLVEMVPGDVFRHNSSVLLRTQPLFAPLMHRVDVSIRHFFVPKRLVWSEFEDFITGGLDGTAAPVPP